MNPLSGALKFFSTTLFNSVLALAFFLIAGHFATPSFVGKVAIIQLMETITGAFFSILPFSLVTREVSHSYASSQGYDKIAYTSLSYSLLVSPLLLFLFFFPSYLWMSIPYFVLYLFTNYQGQLLTGLGKFTEVNIGNAIFTIARWGFSILAVFYHSVELLILIWTLGAITKAVYYQFYLPFKFFLDKTTFKEIAKVGFPIYLTGIVYFISGQGDRVVTAFLLGSYYLGIYQLVALAAVVPSMLIFSFSSSLLPSSTYYYARGKDMKEISSISFRIVTLISLPMAILGYAISPLFISKLFPHYVLGIPSMQLLILSLTSTMPLQLLSTFMIAAKKNYRPFIIIGIISASEVVGVSYYLIPKIGIYGAAIAQVFNVIITSLLYLFFSYSQGIFRLERREIASLALIGFSFLALINWEVVLIAVILGFKLFGIIGSDEVKIIEGFIPSSLKRITKILYLIAK
ncbi:polysaccharide biosynthesis C-terminal domain-containing protein [Acidianus ambivalens]|uniref:Oligosaccharide flippase family protein n=1 Tax=Acidianus ambivalens TaxID=2283 RepID=A0A650CTP9_ACIAM|nr:oligosaccharide flippase family protein [Acidianus ambivalens]MQL56472.1 oligosaccharide flippase family protein [Acidianus ambivalens]QGR21105.1 oligosaccharide flippase family protein [Acidianus ambivalens]